MKPADTAHIYALLCATQREVRALRGRVRELEKHVQRLDEDKPSPDSNDLRPYLSPIEVGE